MHEPKHTSEERRLADLEDWADGLLVAAIEAKAGRDLPPAARALWLASGDLIQHKDPAVRRIGFIMGLDAIIASNAADRVFVGIRAALAEADPALSLIGERALESEA